MMDAFYRIVSSSPITPREVRWAAIFGLAWFTMDVFWFFGTLMHWF